MTKVLLLHPQLLFYKIRIYNKLSLELKQRGYDFYLWPTSVQQADEKIEFNVIDAELTVGNIIKVMRENDIQYVINILFGVRNIGNIITAILLSKLKNIRYIYYGHGLDLNSLNKKWKVFIQNFLHLFADKILLYSPNEIELLWKMHCKKIAVAHNTLALHGYQDLQGANKTNIKKGYGIDQDKVVLFSGRILPPKRLDLLIDMFVQHKDGLNNVALVILGDGLSDPDLERIKKCNNIYYFGPIYDESEVAKIFYMSDVFCIPGSNGLGLVEAIYWDNPVITLEGSPHSPEICYLKDGYNGFMVKDVSMLYPTFEKILFDEKLLKQLSTNARAMYENNASLDKMFEGFYEVLRP